MMNLLVASGVGSGIVGTILYYSTLVLNFAGIAFAIVYLILNIFLDKSDMAERNSAMLKIATIAMGLSIGFAFVSCLLSDPNDIERALALTNLALTIIAISWLTIITLCGLALLLLLVIKKRYTATLTATIKAIFKIALIGVCVSLVLTWLFS